MRPFFSDKYDLTRHPKYHLTADYDEKNYFDIEKFLEHKLELKDDDEYEVIDVTEWSEGGENGVPKTYQSFRRKKGICS